MPKREFYGRDEHGRKPWEAEGIPRQTWSSRQKGLPTREEYLIEKARNALGVDELRRRNAARMRSSRAGVSRVGSSGGSAEKERAKAAIQELEAAGEAVTYETVAKRAGTSSTPVRVALAELAVEKRLVEQRLSETAQQRFDRLFKKAKIELEERLRRELAVEMNELWEERVAKPFAERLDVSDAIRRAHRGLIERKLFRKLIGFLHPDSHVDDFHKTRGEELFRQFLPLEVVLVKPDEPAYFKDLPKSREELMERKRQWQEALRARRAAAKASRDTRPT